MKTRRERLDAHYRINTRLKMLSDEKLIGLLSPQADNIGWGRNKLIQVDGLNIFAKMIPLTDLEMANAYSTRNHYRIPSWYNYGVGSAGFGGFRELAVHQKTTNWVRNAEFAAFPLLHHHRILTMETSQTNINDLKSYLTYWNGSKSVERYMIERSAAKHQLVLFLEHLIPFTDWINKHPSKLHGMVQRALKSVDFLKKNNMIHFDAHAQNWLTDGKDLYLSDFGLALDLEFELTQTEIEFFHQHQNYDYAQVIATIGDGVALSYFALDADQQSLVNAELQQSPRDLYPFLSSLARHALSLHEKNLLRLTPELRRFIERYQPIINTKNAFFLDMRIGKKSTNKYPQKKLTKLLRKLNVVS